MPFNESMEEWTVPLDVREQDGKVIVEASVPGIKAEDIEVSVEEGVLAIKGETKTETEEKKEGYLLKERREGSFYRSVRLPDSVDSTQAASTYKDGVLTVTMPKTPEKQPSKIKVEVQ
jgi:HSP20 family protein